jgi:hypothetical protein
LRSNCLPIERMRDCLLILLLVLQLVKFLELSIVRSIWCRDTRASKSCDEGLGQVTFALACERKWSTFDFIHSRKRNRLTSSRSNDLILFRNIRLRDKVFDPDYKESYIE